MIAEILLDPKGGVPLPEGYTCIDNEVAFLEHSTDDKPLVIRGERICTWAETYYAVHQRPFRYVESPASALQKIFPDLDDAQAQALAKRLGVQSLDSTQTTVVFILETLYSDNNDLWHQKPSLHHAARWLLWLYENNPDEIVQIILHYQAATWSRQSSGPEAIVYQALNTDRAHEFLFAWLGLVPQDTWKTLGEFPETIPTGLDKEIREIWRSKMIESDGAYFEELLHWPLSPVLQQQAAQEALEFYKQNSRILDRTRLNKLRAYLTFEQTSELEQFLPPKTPSPVPEDPQEVVNWFIGQYLPYRLWQQRSKDTQTTEHICRLARDFGLWYLRNYPQWVLQKQYLSFFRTGMLASAKSEETILVVILDGLPVWDAQNLIRLISARIERLTLLNTDYTFAPIPTITEFAKDALLKGVPPRFAPQYSPLGIVLPENTSPQNHLQSAKPGEIYFWRLQEPDRTYHKKVTAGLPHQVAAQLEALVSQLIDVSRFVPEDQKLRIIITTDHGRLLNERSRRKLSVPKGMQAHGRAAWGKLDYPFGETGFDEDREKQVLYIFGERFELSDDLLLPLSEDSFLTSDGKQGHETYPHGGLFPEEVIIPWLVFERDVAEPKIIAEVDGNGEAGKTGALHITIRNLSDLHLMIMSVHVSDKAQKDGEWAILPCSTCEHAISIQPWPSKSEAAHISVQLLIRRLDGRTFEQIVVPNLTVTEMYSRDDSLLKELEL